MWPALEHDKTKIKTKMVKLGSYFSGTGNHQMIQWRSQQEWKEATCQNSHSNIMLTHLARKHAQLCYLNM